MQTFLPFQSFPDSLNALDDKRLGKQRVEAVQICTIIAKKQNLLQKTDKEIESNIAWQNHPAVLMWETHLPKLIQYGITACNIWMKRSFKDTCTERFLELQNLYTTEKALAFLANYKEPYPDWWSNQKVFDSHKAMLLVKDVKYYMASLNLTKPQAADLICSYRDYYWPVTIENTAP